MGIYGFLSNHQILRISNFVQKITALPTTSTTGSICFGPSAWLNLISDPVHLFAHMDGVAPSMMFCTSINHHPGKQISSPTPMWWSLQ
jgi:hypothetical protein